MNKKTSTDLKKIDEEIEAANQKIEQLKQARQQLVNEKAIATQAQLEQIYNQVVELVKLYNKSAQENYIPERMGYSHVDMSDKFEENEEIPLDWHPEWGSSQINSPGADGWFQSQYC